jgi:serine/threonine-protein kinase SRPK3
MVSLDNGNLPTHPVPHSDRSKEEKPFVALKFATIWATKLRSPDERDLLEKVKSGNPQHPGFQHCVALRRSLHVRRIDIEDIRRSVPHLCFVMDPLSSSLHDLRSAMKTFPVPIVKRIVKQVLLALDYLHSECGYYHGGTQFLIFSLVRS